MGAGDDPGLDVLALGNGLAGELASRTAHGTMSDPPLSPLAAFLTGDHVATTTLLAQHVDDGRGRCRVCTIGAQRGHVTWPCTLFTAATAARAVRRRSRDTG